MTLGKLLYLSVPLLPNLQKGDNDGMDRLGSLGKFKSITVCKACGTGEHNTVGLFLCAQRTLSQS